MILLRDVSEVNVFGKVSSFLFGCRKRILPEESERSRRGKLGEDLAADYCKCELGYQVIIRNWTCKKDEIDLICREGEVLVFIEVRARSETALVSGYYSVDRRKKAILRRVCTNYLRQLKTPPKHFRFDIIDVSICKKGEGTVRHYPNVPLFHKHFSAQRNLT